MVEIGHPPRDISAVCRILVAESGEQRRFLVPKDETGRRPTNDGSVCQQQRVTEVQALAGDHGNDCHVHGIADMSIDPSNYQVLGGSDRSRGPEPLSDEPDKRVGEDSSAENHQNGTDDPNRWPPLAGRLPSADKPGDDTGDDHRSDNEEHETADRGPPSGIQGLFSSALPATASPPWITRYMRSGSRRTEMSSNGSPSTTIRSASLPGPTVPMR